MDGRRLQDGNAHLSTVDITVGGKKNNPKTMWERLIKQVDQVKAKQFLDNVYWRCTHRECEPNQTCTRNCLSLLSAQVRSNIYFAGRHLTQKLPLGPMMWKNMRRNAWTCDSTWHTRNRAIVQLFSHSPEQLFLGAHRQA